MLETLQKEASERLGLSLSQEQLNSFQLYYQEMVEWNERINLTSIIEYEAVQVRHFLDSLTLASSELRGDPPDKPLNLNKASLIDIGAGAGFPGLPLKIIYPGLKLVLVDSVGKKTAFLTHLAAKLSFQEVQVITGRAEELGQDPAHREKYNIATGRAVAAWPVLAEYCLPLCRVGGLFISPKKGDLSGELKAAPEVAHLLGAKMRVTPSFELPGDTPGDVRQLIVAQKTGRTARLYPRRTGVPSKQPLGADK